jgi:predicted PurR-regulated permease PerM
VTVALLRWAAPIVVPVLLGILTSYALRPPLDWLIRMRVPRAAGAALLLLSVTGAMGVTAYFLRDDASEIVHSLPDAARKVRLELREHARGAAAPMASVERAAAELAQAAAEASGKPVGAVPAARAKPDDDSFVKRVRDLILAQTTGLVAVAAQLGVAALIAFFLLVAGDAFRRKVARLSGPSLGRRRVSIEILREIDAQVQRYLFVMLVTNILVGVAIWGLFVAYGIPRAALWGVIAGLLHVVPYAGTVLIVGVALVAGLLHLEGLGSAAVFAIAAGAATTVIGAGFNTWLQGRASRMNAVVVLVGVMLFGWLWGAWGLLLGFPLLAVVKAVADRTAGWELISELMAPADADHA